MLCRNLIIKAAFLLEELRNVLLEHLCRLCRSMGHARQMRLNPEPMRKALVKSRLSLYLQRRTGHLTFSRSRNSKVQNFLQIRTRANRTG